MRAAVYPTITYSSPLCSWTAHDIAKLEEKLAGVNRAAWKFARSHNTAQMVLPPERGGVVAQPIVTLMAKAAVGMVERMEKGGDPAMGGLLRSEWQRLQKTWGTGSPRAIQLALLLGDTADWIELPISNMLFITGMAGLTPAWEWMGMRQPGADKDEDKESILETLKGYLMKRITKAWVTKEGGIRKENLLLAQGLRRLLEKGKRMQDLMHPLGGWSVDLAAPEQEQVLTALEQTCEGTSRARIRFSPHKLQELRAVSPITQCREQQRATGKRRAGSLPRKKTNRARAEYGLGNCKFVVTKYDQNTEEYTWWRVGRRCDGLIC